jgi:hypothetical protein
MVDGCFKNLMAKIRPDEIEMGAQFTSPPVIGWVTYLDDVTRKLDVKSL